VRGEGQRFVVFNPLPWKRDGLVTVQSNSGGIGALKPANGGDVVPVELSGGALRFVARDVPAMGYRSYIPVKAEIGPPVLSADAQAGTLENAFLKVTLDSTRGTIRSLVDKRTARDIVSGANRHLAAVNSGFSITDPRGHGIGFCALDYPLVSLGEPGCWKYSWDYVPQQPVAYVNCFNNQYTTNFRFWNSGTWTSRVRLWPIARADADPGSGTDVDVWQPASDAATAGIPAAHRSDGLTTAVKTCGHSPCDDKFAAETGGG
jgi:hypothetical protein